MLKQNSLGSVFSMFLHMPAYLVASAAAKSLQSCPTLCDLINGSPLGSSVPGILQARVLEWGAISGVAQSRTQRKRLSSSSSSPNMEPFHYTILPPNFSVEQLLSDRGAFQIAQLVKNPPTMQETLVQFLGWEDLLEKG